MVDKEEKTSLDTQEIDKILPGSIILAIICGLKEYDGRLTVSERRDRTGVRYMYATLKKLAGEFPEVAHNFSFISGPGGPLSEELETILFRLGSSGVGMFNASHEILEVSLQTKQAILNVLKKRHIEAALKQLARLNQRFDTVIKEV